jgi:hypothetical protein
METRNSRGFIAEALGGTARQRGVKLGIIAGGITIFLLFGASALQQGSSTTVNLDSGQIAGLFLAVLPGFLAIVIAAVLAYYAGLSGPEAKSGEGGRDGLIAGSITMLLFWAGQTLFVLVDGLRSPQGLALGNVLGQRLLAGLLFFVIGGMLGWGGSRAAARRARSILAPPTSSLFNLMDAGSDELAPIDQSAKPEIKAAASDSRKTERRVTAAQQEAAPEASEQEKLS